MAAETSARILRCPLGASNRKIPSCNFGQTLFSGMLDASPTKIALTDVNKKDYITYSSFIAKSELIARHLLRHGCRRGDVISIYAPNSIEWMLMLSAAFRIGLVPAGINSLHKTEEVNQHLILCGAKYVFTCKGSHLETLLRAQVGSDVRMVICDDSSNGDGDGNGNGVGNVNGFKRCGNDNDNYPEYIPLKTLLTQVDDLPELQTSDDIDPESVAVIMFSSGTTGREKAVLLSHINLQAQFIISRDEKIRKVTDNQIIFAPLSHLAGAVMTLYGLALGYSSHIMAHFEIDLYLQTLSRFKTESIAIVPTIAVALAKAPEVSAYDLSFLKEILCGTAQLSRQVIQVLTERFPSITVRQGYGLTETTAMCCCVPRGLDENFNRSKAGSVGFPLYNVEIKVVDLETGAILGPLQNGELLVRSPLVMKGYMDHHSLSRAEVIDQDGWLRTGDMGYYDNDNYLWVVDRIKQMIKYCSFQVSPSELESVLLSHSEVADAAAYGLCDPASGNELPAAWVVRKSGATITEAELDSYISDAVASYKHLRGGITFVSKIPRSATGKILRKQLTY